MSHHRCCCGPGEIDGGDVQCITLMLADIVSEACTREDSSSAEPACDGFSGDGYTRTPGVPVGMSTPFKLAIKNTPATAPYGTYRYGFYGSDAEQIPVSWVVEGMDYNFYGLINQIPRECGQSWRFTHEGVSAITQLFVDIDYQPGQPPKVVRVDTGMAGFKYTKVTQHNPPAGPTVTVNTFTETTDIWGNGNSYESDQSGPWDLGESIPNDHAMPAGCTEGFKFHNHVGSAIVNIDPDDACLDAIQIFKAQACGTPTGGQPSVIYVDLANRSSSDLAQGRIHPRFNGWPYNLTDEHEPNQTPTAGVIWSATPCFPTASLCGNPSVTGGFDPEIRPRSGQTIVAALNFRWIPNGGATNQVDITGTWEDAPCPGSKLIAGPENSSEPRDPTSGPRVMRRNATQQMTRKGLVSEVELDAMGADPEHEARAARQGGCCGQPSQ